MTDSTKLLLGLGGAVGLYLLLKARTIGNLVFSGGQIQSIRFDGVTPIIEVAIVVQNTSAMGVTVQSMAGNVFTSDGGNSTLIGNVSFFQPVNIAGNSPSVIVFNVRARVLGIMNDVITAFQTKNFTKQLDFQCMANVGGLQVPVNFKIPVGV